MHLVYEIVTLVHLVGFAALLGGCLVQFRAVEPEVNLTMLIGAWTQVVSGLVLAGLLVLGIGTDSDGPADYVELGIKLAIAAVVLLLVAKNRRFASIPKGLWALITGLTLIDAGIAVFWS